MVLFSTPYLYFSQILGVLGPDYPLIMKNSDFNDVLHWKGIISGDHDSYKFFYEKYITSLFSYGMKFYGKEEDVKDAIHDLFLDLYSYRSRLVPEANVKYYLLLSLRRRILSNAKKINFSLRFNPDEMLGLDEQESSHEQVYIDKESDLSFLSKMRAELESLPERQKEAIYLRYSQNLDYEEIARLMGVNLATCRTLIYRSIKQLRNNLQHRTFSASFEFIFQ